MKILKISVIAMGVLIATGIVVLLVAIGDRMGGSDAYPPTSIDLPPNATIAETRLEGDRIAIRLQLANGGSRILLINLRTGKQEGLVELNPRP